MLKWIFCLACLPAFQLWAQPDRPTLLNYWGSTHAEAKQRLVDYLLYYGYHGQFDETDSTIELLLRRPGTNWTCTSTFYFGTNDSCQCITHHRCDDGAGPFFDGMLADKKAGWVRLDERTYVSRHVVGTQIEVLQRDSCLVYRTRKQKLSKADYRSLLRQP